MTYNPIWRVAGRGGWGHNIRIALAAMIVFAVGAIASEASTIRVGLYQNKPKVFTDENGRAAGIFIDILDETAKREGWTLVYAPCEWAECLRALEEGRIDLMPDVAYSPERDEKYDFASFPIFVWYVFYMSLLYDPEGVECE